MAGGLLWLLAAIALLSHSPLDAAWSTSGDGGALVHNRIGVLGAWVSDLGFFLFGRSVWWLLVAGASAWLSALARLLRHDVPLASSAVAARPPGLMWLGLALLLGASCALEWTRLYGSEAVLPGGAAGGALGSVLGAFSQRAIGFLGSGLLWIAMLVVALPLALRFSWFSLAERLGAALEGWREQRELRIERAEDARLGEQACASASRWPTSSANTSRTTSRS